MSRLGQSDPTRSGRDIELSYREAGAGRPLVLLHGNGEDGSYFAHQIECFAERFHVFAPDTRGHGASPRGTAPFTLSQFADDLGAFLDDRGLCQASLLGFSDGANIALLFALAHPERVSQLVLNGANLFPAGLTDEVNAEIAAEYAHAKEAGDEHALELLRLMIDEPRIDPADLAALPMPVLVIAGTHDMISEDHTRLIAESIPGSQLRFVEGSHFVAAENPAEFNRAVLDFLLDER